MAAKRALLLLLGLLLVASLLVGCGSAAQDATFIGYKLRPADSTPGIAIVQLSTGEPAEAECSYSTLENGTPIKVEKAGSTYKVIGTSPDWK